MKVSREVVEVSGEGLESFLGKKIIVYCMNYIYTGELEGVNSTCIKLRNPFIVYETGAHSANSYKDSQSISSPHYIQTSAIESFGLGK